MGKPIFTDEGNVIRVQRDQMANIASVNRQAVQALDASEKHSQEDSSSIDEMLAQAEALCRDAGVDFDNDNRRMADPSSIDALLSDIHIDKIPGQPELDIDEIDRIEVGDDWGSYMHSVDTYAKLHNIDFTKDPFHDLLTPDERHEIIQKIEDDYKYHGVANCDMIDYELAAVCGVISGLVDSFFVGMPGASKLGKVVDKVADKTVEKFAHFTQWCDKKHIMELKEKGEIQDWSDYKPTGVELPKKIHNKEYYKNKLSKKVCRPLTQRELDECEARALSSSIGYLQDRFRVPYDARYAKDLSGADGVVSFSTVDHHLKSLAHNCDLSGLFFSILDQFTGMTTIIADGKIKRFKPTSKKQSFNLQGTNFCTKVLFGCINWFGHLMSDVVGSSGTRGHVGTRGAGIATPFFKVFQKCNFGSIDVAGDKKTLAEFTSAMYANGYDVRFAATQAIPVALNEMLIRLCWSVKRHYYHKLPWSECVPSKISDKPELRRMLLVGHGCLCLVDVADAAIRSWGNLMGFALHFNSVGWTRFARRGYLEICALYKKNLLNTEQMETDLAAEWEVLLKESEVM